jgi:hypothetical protein
MSKASDKKLIDALIKELTDEVHRQSGWRVEPVSKSRKHATVYPPDGQRQFTLPTTPSDHRWKPNLRAELRRAGWKGKILD